MPFSIEQYKLKLQVRAAQNGRRSTRATATSAARANAAFVFDGLQKTYLDFCVAKTLDPDNRLLASLKTRSFVLTLDSFSTEELSLHMEFLHKTSSLRQIALTLSSAAVDREVRKKFERLRLSRSPAFEKRPAARILKSVCAACTKSPNLSRLQLCGISIAETEAALLSKTLAKCDQLELLNLSGAMIGDDGLAALSLVLGKRSRLYYLNLSKCGLTSNAKDHLVKILSLYGTLRDETAWSAGLRGAAVPSHSMRPTLLMDLSHNVLRDASMEAIRDALCHNKWILGLSLVDNELTIKGLTQCRDMVLQDNLTLAVLKLSQQDATPDSESVVRSVDTAMAKRMRYLRAMGAESSERRLFLCNLLLEWNVGHDIVLELCNESLDHQAERQVELEDNQGSRGEGDGGVHPPSRPPVTTGSNHIHTIKYLVDRLSAMEAEQQKTARLVERLEKENHDLRVTVKVMAERSTEVIPPALEESVIAQLEASVAKLGKQIEDLERERNSRTKC